MVPGSLGWGAVVFAAMTIFAPSRAALSAMALPIPRLAPVMNRTFPSRLDMVSPSGLSHDLTEGREGKHGKLQVLEREGNADDRHRQPEGERDVAQEDPDARDDKPEDV